MASSTHRAGRLARRMLTCAVIGLACGAVFGVLYVLVAWFPGAMATYAENPQFVDPRHSVMSWCVTWATVCGAVGLIVGLVVGAFKTVTARSN